MKFPSKKLTTFQKRFLFFNALLVVIVAVLIIVNRGGIHELNLPPRAGQALQRAGIDTLRVGRTLLLTRNDRSSANTHGASAKVQGRWYANALDIAPAWSAASRRKEIHALRLAGFAAWSRGVGEPGGPAGAGPHYHCVWAGAKSKLKDNKEQICSFVHGLKGLSKRGKTKGQMRDVTITRSEIAAVKKMYESVNGKNSLDGCSTYESRH